MYDERFVTPMRMELTQLGVEGAKNLTSKGVDAKRLSSQGYGPDKPIADNKNAAGRAKNRRVEFRIVSSTKKPASPPPK